jgi:hypothetical protein
MKAPRASYDALKHGATHRKTVERAFQALGFVYYSISAESVDVEPNW